ncbi:MAG: 3-hydroxyacyl-CoA dehydrogenase family protein [Bacteroidetes bacterium]|jgi:3-hydroxybutyryl-CoA dehydrogenase|nr:3-hydroxyacyl-CoA dehydrogenase family protein [Bacteroidota bacterium]
MKKYLIATQAQQQYLATAHPGILAGTHCLATDAQLIPEAGDWVLDLSYEQHPHRLAGYLPVAGATILLGNVLHSLGEQVHRLGIPARCQLYGVNHLPGFLALPAWELCKLQPEAPAPAHVPPYQQVADEVGLVTPRVLAMIINEAYYLLQEETASAEDIDAAMKLGVNYPKGPLAWAQEIGPGYIAELLIRLQRATGQEKYSPCRLLRQQRLKTS